MDYPRTYRDIGSEMESVNCHSNKEGSRVSDLDLHLLDTGRAPAAPTKGRNFDGVRGTATLPFPRDLDHPTDLHAPRKENTGHAFVSLPDFFDGRKEEYRRFRRQFGLFLTANPDPALRTENR
jgi:hypothetical protein